MGKLSLFAVALILAFLGGCASKDPVDAIDTLPATRTAIPITLLDLPDWYTNTPEEDDIYVYGTGSADSKKIEIAISKATQNARVMISERVETNVQSMIKNFAQEAGVNEDTQLRSFYQETSKSISNNTHWALQVLKEYPYIKPGGSYQGYVLVGLRKDDVKDQLMGAIKNEAALYSEFKASQAFKELEESVN